MESNEETYLEILVPLSTRAKWFRDLKNVMRKIDIHLSDRHYHITMVFVEDNPNGVDLKPILNKHLSSWPAPTLTFDKIDCFTSRSGKQVINLTATNVPESFLAKIKEIRADLEDVGCVVNDFLFHVTLHEVKSERHIERSTICNEIRKVEMPSFSLLLTKADYGKRGSKEKIKMWSANNESYAFVEVF
jgi:2'-5' RNA ligase